MVRIADGDTLTILSPDGDCALPSNTALVGADHRAARTQHKIRLYGIDAPEKSQAFGQKSKQHLSSLVFGKDIRVKYKSRDKYGRILGTIYVDGRDINLEMLRAGFAHHYKRYDKNPAYSAAETEARAARRGLWSDPNPISPEEYRHRDKSTAPPAASSAAPVNDALPDTGFWLSTNSNKRHNRKCENYRKTRGYPCSSSDGTPCGKCGG